ncbi:hypothetical protein [Sphingobacterium griseoflavum]|uniref:Uncharacterized protein n=1 Tax=Sphingobacterium griseoflavum TaxID=1474952 RepID=A0ABQ3HX68_9SPHI|nr:hypothetical protein [Sphingobacterium griseoflavum]GHE28991.1 hypothetical protein GCM10017764_09510 [Sphingobacterium griseoflavum]
MNRKPTLNFFNINDHIEDLPVNELFKLKGGNSDDTIDGGELEEVIIEPPEDPWEDEWPDNEDDNWGEDEEPWQEPDWWDDNETGGPDPAEQPDPEEPEEECTCELSSPKPLGLPSGISDPNSLLSKLGGNVTSQMKSLIDNKASLIANNPSVTEESIARQLATYDKIINMIDSIENSGYSFRVERGNLGANSSTIQGGFGKAENGQYVITIDAHGGFSEDEMLVHELYHAFQMINGEIGFDANGVPTMVGMEDEIAAYQLQYDFGAGAANSPKIATEADIRAEHPGVYDNLTSQGGSCPVHG